MATSNTLFVFAFMYYSKLKHPNILQYYGFCLKPLRFVMDFAPNNARNYLFPPEKRDAVPDETNNTENKSNDLKGSAPSDLEAGHCVAPKITEYDKWTVAYQIASGMAFLHRQNPPIFHRNLKLENCLVRIYFILTYISRVLKFYFVGVRGSEC